MVHSIKYKILFGTILFVLLIALSAGMILYNYAHMNTSLLSLMRNNYQTIQACQQMLDAIEREDSGILMLWLGEWKEGRSLINKADSAFAEGFTIALNNLTEPNEDKYVTEIEQHYTQFKAAWERPIVDTDKQGNIDWYYSEIQQAFIRTKSSINQLMILNQDRMFEEANSLSNAVKIPLCQALSQ